MSELERIVGKENIASPLSRDDSIAVKSKKINELIKGKQVLPLFLGPESHMLLYTSHSVTYGTYPTRSYGRVICGYDVKSIKQYLIISGEEPEIWEVEATKGAFYSQINLKLVTDELLSRIKTYAQALNLTISANASSSSSSKVG